MKSFFKNLVSDEQQKLLVRLTSQTFVIRLAGLGLIYFSQVLLARLLGVKDYGIYTVIMTWINILVVACVFGFDHSTIRFFSSYFVSHDWSRARGYLRFSFRTSLVASIGVMILMFLFLLYKSKEFKITYSETFFWSIFLLPFLVLIYQASAVFRSLRKIKLALSSIYILLPLLISLLCLVYYQLNNDLLTANSAMFIAMSSSAVVAWFIMSKLKRNVKSLFSIARPVFESRLWGLTALTFLGMNLLTILIKQADILFVSHFMNHTQAGLYAAAVKISTLVPFGLSIVEFVFTPRISSLYAAQKFDELQQYINHASRLILLLTIPIAIVLIGGGKYLLLLFGPEFKQAYGPMLILIAGQLVNAITGMVGPLMTMTGNQRLFLLIYFFTACLNFSLNYSLVPEYGMTGAAISTAISVALLNITVYFVVRRKLKIKSVSIR